AWVAAAFEDAPPLAPADAEPVSVVVCTHNGAATLRECLEGAFALDYPRFEVIVVDDGSTDASAAIARELGARLVSTGNRRRSGVRRCSRAVGSIRSSAPPATTSTSAGGYRRRAGRSASTPRRLSGTAAGRASAASGASRSATDAPRHCSSGSGPRSTTRQAT